MAQGGFKHARLQIRVGSNTLEYRFNMAQGGFTKIGHLHDYAGENNVVGPAISCISPIACNTGVAGIICQTKLCILSIFTLE